MKIINLTPHAVRVLRPDGELAFAISPSGAVARVTTDTLPIGTVAGAVVSVTIPGRVAGLPDATLGTVLLVSLAVRAAVPTRADVLSPGELVRDAAGQPIGCRGLAANPGWLGGHHMLEGAA